MNSSSRRVTHVHVYVRYLGSHETEKLQRGYQVRKVRDMPEHARKMPRPWVPVQVGGTIQVRILFEQRSYASSASFRTGRRAVASLCSTPQYDVQCFHVPRGHWQQQPLKGLQTFASPHRGTSYRPISSQPQP